MSNIKFTDATTNMNQNSSEFKLTVTNAVIGGVISCSLLLIILLILVITCMCDHQEMKKKFASINIVDSTGMNTYIRGLDTSSKINFLHS